MAHISELKKEIQNLKKEIHRASLFRKRIYTVKEAAYVSGVSISYVQKLIASNKIAYSKPSGKLIFIRRRDLEKFLLNNYISDDDVLETVVANQLIKSLK